MPKSNGFVGEALLQIASCLLNYALQACYARNRRAIMSYKILLLCIFFFPLAAAQDLQQFVTDFYKKWAIQEPINIEYSVKFSPQGINSDRYVVQIPQSYLDVTNNKQLDDLVAFIPSLNIQQQMKNDLKQHDVGALLYAVEGAGDTRRYKTYFDFGKEQGTIHSYEWRGNDAQFTPRDYVLYPRYKGLLETMLSRIQLLGFRALRPFLDESATMWKKGGTHNTLCFKFKPDIKVSDVKKYITELVRSIANKSGAIKRQTFELIMSSIKQYPISWISISPGEITIYYRKEPWSYYRSKKS